MTEALDKLRQPFPKGTVGVLPKPYKKDAPKAQCAQCGGYHGLPAAHLDFVGHAAVTDRLLSVDPQWTWEPMATTPEGLPMLDRDGNLWIKLTVCGVTRLGVGDGMSMKERIGDAIRNAAMRFGVALDLWTKDELESQIGGSGNEKPAQGLPDAPPGPDDVILTHHRGDMADAIKVAASDHDLDLRKPADRAKYAEILTNA